MGREDLSMPGGMNTLEQQKWLNQHGFVGENGDPLEEDGLIGANTNWAVASVGRNAFDYNAQCIAGYEGLWTHTNVRKDKFDCFPQPELREMIASL